MSQLSPEVSKLSYADDADIISDIDNCPDCHSRAYKNEMKNQIVPIVTCAREKDKGVITISIGNSTNTDNTPSAQVTIGTRPITGANQTDESTSLRNITIKMPASARFLKWDGDTQENIHWFMTAPRMNKPFYLDQYTQIILPALYYESIERDIQVGPSGPRAKYGALMDDLKKLKAIICGPASENKNHK